MRIDDVAIANPEDDRDDLSFVPGGQGGTAGISARARKYAGAKSWIPVAWCVATVCR